MFVVFFSFFFSYLFQLPMSKSLSLNWNFGSLLGIIYLFQVVSGLFMAFFFSSDSLTSFDSVQHVMYEVNFGWFMRILHFNGASFFFFVVFLHFFKGLFFFSYRLYKVWLVGLLMLLLLMGVAFMGYVLVWAQMSFWAAVVITSLLTIIPIYGVDLVLWVWGSFCVFSSTLKFFFVLHFFLPWFFIVFIVVHIFFLHSTGSTSKLYYCGQLSKITFFPFFVFKDLYNLIIYMFFIVFFLFMPFVLGDSEMFILSNMASSPVHIVPEWYFLFAYAILRSIPNKMFGVFFLVFSIFVFVFFVFFRNYLTLFNVLNKFFVFLFFFNSVILSWIGQCQVQPPFVLLGYYFTVLYFFFIFMIFLNYISSYFIFLYLL